HLTPSLYFLSHSVHRRYLHSFPTRRSSDLERQDEDHRPELQRARHTGQRRQERDRLEPCARRPRTRAACAAGGRSKRRSRSPGPDRKSTRLNSSHVSISYAVFCLKKKTIK